VLYFVYIITAEMTLVRISQMVKNVGLTFSETFQNISEKF